MKILIIVTHPNIQDSIINQRWIEELYKYPEKFYVHQLHEVYPNEKIDVMAEQKLIEQYDKIVFINLRKCFNGFSRVLRKLTLAW